MLDIRPFHHGNKAFKREIYFIFSSNMYKDTKKKETNNKIYKEMMGICMDFS